MAGRFGSRDRCPRDTGTGRGPQAARAGPNLAEWHELPSALSSFLYFTSSGPFRSQYKRFIDLSVVQEIAAPLLVWSRVPGAPLVIKKSLAQVVVPESQGVEVLLEGLPTEPQFGLWRATPEPRRLKYVDFSWATGSLQVLDPTPPQTQLEALLDGLRIVSSHLDYASVRRSMASAPNESDMVYLFKRNLTYLEQQHSWGMTAHLLADFVPDAYVAQVLTDSHLAKASDLSLFHIEPMGKGRHLVRARDPAPWINDATPSKRSSTRPAPDSAACCSPKSSFGAHSPD